MLEEENILITVTRKTLPSLKATAYRDFLDILNKNDVYNPNNHNKTELTYKIGSNEIEFISVDNFEKVKGRKRDYLFCNEANELNFNDFTQLALRTTKQIFLDYNPSHDEYHWIEEKVKTRDDVYIIKSTYKDNPFNSPETIKEIERLKDTDPNLWRIYGLGLMGIASARIWTHFELCDELPEAGETIYGLDFGFNHPTALVEIREYDDAYYVDELIYQSGMTNNDLIEKMKELGVKKGKFIFCDSAEPARIEEIRRAGFNAHSSDKDVKKGIDTIKSKRIYPTKRSINLLKESKGYSWKTTADGQILDEPVRVNDDACCALRYGVHTYIVKKSNKPNIRLL
jgi:phage terminase large subunit